MTIKTGETVQLTASARDIFGNEISCVVFEWSSSDQSVAVVDQNGLVQGVGEGRAIVSATAKKEGYNLAFKGEAIVNVIPAGPAKCSLNLMRNNPVVSGGELHTCVIKQDGSLRCWGWNQYGQVGDGKNIDRNTPVQIMSGGVIAVSAGWANTCAIKQGGSLWCWGRNEYGQMGDGTWDPKNTPVQIISEGVVAVFLGI